jgi:hypothetical protein
MVARSVILLLAGALAPALAAPPVWSPTYSLQGVLTIPFAEIQVR